VPCPTITVPGDQLPDLSQSWAWAHAQLDPEHPGDLTAGRSRLLCPSHLATATPMRAVLVPAFQGGLDAGLGGVPRPGANLPAWTAGTTTAVTLPVYDHWTFITGDGRDFEYLVERIAPVTPGAVPGFGSRDVDLSDPFFTAPAETAAQVVPVGSALMPIPTSPPSAAQLAALDSCAQALATRINADADQHAFGPPVRGQHHSGRSTVAPTDGDWLDTANRDPRHRLAAARGADWVIANQDDLMAQSWQQAGQIRAAAHRLAIARAACAVSESLHTRHVQPLSLDEQITLVAPAASRMRPSAPGTTAPAGWSLADVLTATAAPNGLGTTAYARLTRARVPGRRSTTGAALTSAAMAGDLLGAPGVTPLCPVQRVPDPAALTQMNSAQRLLVGPAQPTPSQLRLDKHLATVTTVARQLSHPFPTLSTVLLAAGGTLQRTVSAPGVGVTVLKVAAAAATAVWQSPPTPAVAVQRRITSMLSTASPAHAATDDLQPALPTPTVTTPLALGLNDRDPNWMIAGVARFPEDSATLLQPDTAFIESALLGANYALLDEYLWRGFPTDRRGTPIRNFWPSATPGGADILPIDQWPTGSVLGTNTTGTAATTSTILLIRSQLFERYPDTIVAAVPATMNGGTVTPDYSAGARPPSFPLIAVDTRTRLAGFTIDHNTLRATPGYFFVFVQPHTGLRFGIENWPTGQSFLDPQGFNDSAALAAATLRLPVRLFLHSSRMVQ
jgi:hypothetical protein